MRRNQQRLVWLGISILGVLTLSSVLLGQASPNSDAAVPTISDWSNNHVVFSRPANADLAARLQQDPRYWQQLYRRSQARMLEPGGYLAPGLHFGANHSPSGQNLKLKRDWAVDMGTGATIGATNYPAKYSLTTTTASCAGAAQPDFAVYSTGLFGSGTQANIVAYDNLYSGCSGLSLGSAANFAMLASSTITNAGASVVTGGNIGISPGTSLTGFPPGVLTAPAIEHLGDAVAAQAQADANAAYTFYQGLSGAALIAPLLDGLTFTPGLYNAASTLALSAGQTVTLNGSGTYIFQVGSTLTLSGTVVLSGGATASNVIWLVGSSATINADAVSVGDILALASITLDSGASVTGRAIALNGAVTMIDNAVTTVDTVPSVYWAYSTTARILTSPVFSRDGTQVAFVQTAGSHGSLTLLKWAASTTETIGSPQTLTRVLRSAYTTCAAPCFTTFALSDLGVLANDSGSSVFYDYNSDTAYVGDDSGWLHKFTPVFLGVLSEVTTGWPVQVNPLAPTPLTGPVYDRISGNVFVADTGGFLYFVDSLTGGIATTSGQLDFSSGEGGAGIVQGPVVDAAAGLVYVFASSDGSGSCVGGADCTAVYQLTTNFIAGDTGSEAVVGASTISGSAPSPLYLGSFDSTYQGSLDPPTGNLYVCGNTGGPPVLYQVPIAAGAMNGLGIAGPVLSTSSITPCSPVSDVANPNVTGGATEWVFASVQNGGISSGCASGGCVFNFKDTPWLPLTAYTVGQEVLDSHLQIQVVTVAGTSGHTAPAWSAIVQHATTDGTVHWLNQGLESATTLAAWLPSHTYPLHSKILDGNNNVEFVTTAGTSGTSTPAFTTTPGGVTSDGTGLLKWTNLGALGTSNMPVAGGTSGIVFDNVVGSGTQAGASQVYFSTLSDQTCATSGGTGGCAVQASQSQLK
jgi:hypothetical protein